MIRLLDSCIRLLTEQGMSKMFIDAVKGGDEGFQSMGESKPKLRPGILIALLTQHQASKNGRGTETPGGSSNSKAALGAWRRNLSSA